MYRRMIVPICTDMQARDMYRPERTALHCTCQLISGGASSGHDVPLRTSPTWQANTSIDTCNRMQRNAVVCARMHTRSNVCLCTHMQSHAVECFLFFCARMRAYAYTIVCALMHTNEVRCSRMFFFTSDRRPNSEIPIAPQHKGRLLIHMWVAGTYGGTPELDIDTDLHFRLLYCDAPLNVVWHTTCSRGHQEIFSERQDS